MEIALIIFIGGLIVWGLSGIRFVPEGERWPVELFGRYRSTIKPGLNWYLPGIMRIRAKVDIRNQKIPLYEEPIKIDFRDGSAVPKGSEAIVRVKNPDSAYPPVGRLGRPMTGVERVVYEVANWKELVKDLLENALRSYLNTLTIDEGITKARAGFDLKNHLPEAERGRLEETLASWGIELTQATIMDFDLEASVTEARAQVHIEQRKAEAAKAIARRQATEWVRVILEIMAQSRGKQIEEIEAEIERNLELRREFLDYAKELNLRLLEAERGAFLDIRTQNFLQDLIALWKRIPMGKGPTKLGEGEKRKEKPEPFGRGKAAQVIHEMREREKK